MRKIYLLMTVMTVFLWGCGDAGIESDISKTSEFNFAVSATTLNTNVGVDRSESFNFSNEEFSTYIADAQKFTLNRLEFEVVGLTSTPTSTMDLAVRIDMNNNTASQTDGDNLLTVTGVLIANTTSPVLLFSTDATNPGLANNAVIAALEQAILSGATVELELTSTKDGPDITEDFEIKLLFDLTARVELN